MSGTAEEKQEEEENEKDYYVLKDNYVDEIKDKKQMNLVLNDMCCVCMVLSSVARPNQ